MVHASALSRSALFLTIVLNRILRKTFWPLKGKQGYRKKEKDKSPHMIPSVFAEPWAVIEE